MKQNLRNIFLLLLILFTGVAWAASEIELIAPGGGEVDLKQNVTKYYANAPKVVEAHWQNAVLEAQYLEFYRDQKILKAKDRVKLKELTSNRVLKCGAMTVDLNRDYCTASKGVLFEFDNNTFLSGNSLEWDNKNANVKVLEKTEIDYKDWKIYGDRIDGEIDRGLFTITGSVRAIGVDATIKAGRLVFDQESEKLTLQDDPIIVRGKNEMSATEISYDLKTKKITASGPVKTRVLENR